MVGIRDPIGCVPFARGAMTNVLLVEDDERLSEPLIREPLIRVLRAEAFDVVHVAAG